MAEGLYDQEQARAEAAVQLAMICKGHPILHMSTELIRIARRYAVLASNLVDEKDQPFALKDDVPLLPALAGYLLELNEKGASLFSSLDEDQKAEARRIFQKCLEVIDS